MNKTIQFFKELIPNLPHGYNEESSQGIMVNSLLKKLKFYTKKLKLWNNSDKNIHKIERKEKNWIFSY